MGALDRPYDRGSRQGDRSLRAMGEEFRIARLSLGLSQDRVARSARISRPVYGRIERGILRHLPVLMASRIAAVLGLDLVVRAYPGGNPTRDAAHAERLGRLLANVGQPLSYRTEVPLPATSDHPERRSWDAVVTGVGERTAIELETRLYDVQAQLRRINLKWRDDPADHLLVVVADTRPNRRVLREFAPLLSDFPRVGTAATLAALRAGHHPGTSLILF